MIVVSDTSPINYLVLIGFQHIVPKLFERILNGSLIVAIATRVRSREGEASVCHSTVRELAE